MRTLIVGRGITAIGAFSGVPGLRSTAPARRQGER